MAVVSICTVEVAATVTLLIVARGVTISVLSVTAVICVLRGVGESKTPAYGSGFTDVLSVKADAL